MHSFRQFSFLQSLKRHGQALVSKLPPRSLAVLCPACPQIGINITLDDWKHLPRDLEYVCLCNGLIRFTSHIPLDFLLLRSSIQMAISSSTSAKS